MTANESTTVATADDLLQLENQVCFALAVASRSVISLYRPILEPLGLTHPQYLVMLALWQHSPRSVKDLGGALQLEPATLSPLLKRLETAGLVRRDRSRLDERVLDVSLTTAGRELRTQAEAIPHRVMNELRMDAEHLTQLREMLHAVIGAATTAPAVTGVDPL
ncbi:MarR family transcriptional regulator [Plantibacter flavus]|uniref:DNA-binding transcriptional regulator, MarR family n=1 Tax=Plantibacter cousiniae (nom. nud.) TaxID=199709 RepID=A0ABY1LN86_9MICO|nr:MULTISPECIES: MarR family transcriptional regulator [Plantibacter]MBD8517838.1 MarR family transcriptional regulator [Plantibacter sp. CFBP 8804]TKJ95751.1 MarR family transcriptional regulator [Plantibacter flavus]SKC67753.1 DNA-binding transcriptional regulator, MarR family [Plantibacter cousiniae]